MAVSVYPTRTRIITEALRLFGTRGYTATPVAEVERAAGLSPGAGGLYRHFRSKQELLAAAVRHHVARTRELLQTGGTGAGAGLPDPEAPLAERLAYAAHAGLALLDEQRDLTRMQFRDLDAFPELAAELRDGIVQPVYDTLADWLARQPELAGTELDWQGVAAVIGVAMSGYWLAGELLGEPPGRVDRDRFIRAWVRVVLCLVPGDAGHEPRRVTNEEPR